MIRQFSPFVVSLMIISLVSWSDAVSQSQQSGISIKSMADWRIVVPADAIPSEGYAAEELQKFFEEATGIQLPIMTELGEAARCIYVGPGPEMKASVVGFDTSEFGPEDLRVVVGKSSIAIAGGRPRGTLYGVYTFLEDCLGVRFLTPDHTYVPRISEDAVLRLMDKHFSPQLSYRFCGSGELHRDRVFAARMRVNGSFGKIDEKLGGNSPQGLINHSFSRYVPWDKYGKSHPEYFNETNGKRPTETVNDHYGPGVQLCTTNPEVRKLIIEGVLKDLQDQPGRGNISVSQNDGRNFCTCPQCKRLDDAAGSYMGSLLALVNDVADAVAEKHPDVLVGTLSYQYSQKAPAGMVPRPNVQIQLCSYETCLIHPIGDPTCEKNADFHKDLLEWGKISSNINIWCYVASFKNYPTPLPLLRSIGPNIRLFAENNVKGIFAQGPESGSNLGGLRNYIICNMLWDPSRNEQQLTKEFLELHYGNQVGAIQQYIEIIHGAAESADVHRNCQGRPGEYGITPEVASKALEVLEKAMASTGDKAIRGRLEKETIGCYGVFVDPVTSPASKKIHSQLTSRDNGKPFTLNLQKAKSAQPWLTKFFALCRKHGVKQFSEVVAMNRIEQVLRDGYKIGENEDFSDAKPGLLLQGFDSKPEESGTAVELARPTPQQAAWQDMEIGMFLHLSTNTWDPEYGRTFRYIHIPAAEINPDRLDTDQWAQAAVDMGAKFIVFVAKHHTGFCWWQTETTDFGVRSSPWRDGKGDVLADLAASCRKRGLKLGVYLSPRDDQFGAGNGGRCDTAEKQEQYNRYYRQHLTEVLSLYGEMIEVWFDGSIVVPVGDILQRYAPQAMIFQGPHTTIRWVGNEQGICPYPAWNTVSQQAADTHVATAADSDPDGEVWLPIEVDTFVSDDWFWHPQSTVRSLEELLKVYYSSVGHGGLLLLNQAPDRSGLIPSAAMARGKQLGDEIRRRFGTPLAETSGAGNTLEISLKRPAPINHVILREDILQGERVREYVVEGFSGSQWHQLAVGSAIGNKKIDRFRTPGRLSRVRLRIIQSVAEPQIRQFAVYATGAGDEQRHVFPHESETILLNHSFKSDPKEAGWQLLQFDWAQSSAKGHWSAGKTEKRDSFLSVEDGYWQGPLFDVTPHQYYRLSFQSRAQVPGYWAAMFYDADGQMLQADHNSGIDLSDEWIDNEFFFQGKANAVSARLWFYPTSVKKGKNILLRNMSLLPADSRQVLAWADRLYATMPPIEYEPLPDRWSRIPRSIEKLKKGEKLRVVILGDSIGNDTGNSPLDKLIERQYPASHVEIITSIRGGTGCQYYQHENRVEEYVVRYKPDLVMIIAISHGHDAEAIGNVVRQIRKQCDTEIIVTTGPIGQDKLMIASYAKNNNISIDEAPAIRKAFLANVKNLAEQENVEFIPLRKLWNDYMAVATQKHNVMWFMRDQTHANVRGRQVVARLLERYFQPN